MTGESESTELERERSSRLARQAGGVHPVRLVGYHESVHFDRLLEFELTRAQLSDLDLVQDVAVTHNRKAIDRIGLFERLDKAVILSGESQSKSPRCRRN